MYFPQELLALLHLSGFDLVRAYGGYKGQPFGPDAGQQLLLCSHAASALKRPGRPLLKSHEPPL